MALRSGTGYPYEALWAVECSECGEFWIAWAQGHAEQFFRLNPQPRDRHVCLVKNLWHDDLPRSWFAVVLADGAYLHKGVKDK